MNPNNFIFDRAMIREYFFPFVDINYFRLKTFEYFSLSGISPLRILLSLFLFMCLFPLCAFAKPPCVNPDAKNIVLANVTGDLSNGWEGEMLLQNIATSDRIFLRRCKTEFGVSCYYATDVVPGKYFFQEVAPGAGNQLNYPVSGKTLWFEITGKGVDYIGDWNIRRGDGREVNRLEIKYTLKHLDEMISTCEISGKRLFLGKTKAPASEIVD